MQEDKLENSVVLVGSTLKNLLIGVRLDSFSEIHIYTNRRFLAELCIILRESSV